MSNTSPLSLISILCVYLSNKHYYKHFPSQWHIQLTDSVLGFTFAFEIPKPWFQAESNMLSSGRSTSSAKILEQLKQTQRIMVRTVFRKPIWNIGLASSKWPKWPGHSAISAVHVSHLIFLSTVPRRGSLNPPTLGLPLSLVSPCSICTTDICLCNQTNNKITVNDCVLRLWLWT